MAAKPPCLQQVLQGQHSSCFLGTGSNIHTDTPRLGPAATVVTSSNPRSSEQRAAQSHPVYDIGNKIKSMTRSRDYTIDLVFETKRLRLSASTQEKPKNEVHCAYLVSEKTRPLSIKLQKSPRMRYIGRTPSMTGRKLAHYYIGVIIWYYSV